MTACYFAFSSGCRQYLMSRFLGFFPQIFVVGCIQCELDYCKFKKFSLLQLPNNMKFIEEIINKREYLSILKHKFT